MCFHSLAARGVRKVRFTRKEECTKRDVPHRDEEKIATKKNNRRKEARRRPAKEKRARRSWVKKEKEGFRTLKRVGLVG